MSILIYSLSLFIMLFKKKDLSIISQSWKVIYADTRIWHKVLYWITERIFCELSEYQTLFKSELDRLGSDVWCLDLIVKERILNKHREGERA